VIEVTIGPAGGSLVAVLDEIDFLALSGFGLVWVM